MRHLKGHCQLLFKVKIGILHSVSITSFLKVGVGSQKSDKNDQGAGGVIYQEILEELSYVQPCLVTKQEDKARNVLYEWCKHSFGKEIIRVEIWESSLDEKCGTQRNVKT